MPGKRASLLPQPLARSLVARRCSRSCPTPDGGESCTRRGRAHFLCSCFSPYFSEWKIIARCAWYGRELPLSLRLDVSDYQLPSLQRPQGNAGQQREEYHLQLNHIV